MSERRIEHVYNCSAEHFWQSVFIDPEYNRRVYLEALHFESWRMVSEEQRGDGVHRVIEACPEMPEQLPGALKKLISSGLGYTERGVYDVAKQRYELTVTPQSMGNKLDISGVLTTEPIDDSHCRRVYLGRVKAKVFGVGGMIEQRILDDVARSYAKVADFTNRYLMEG